MSLHWWAHLIDGTGRLLSYLAAACAEDLGEVLASGKKMSNRDFTFVGKSWTQWRVNFTQLISMCLKRDEHNKAHNPQQDSNTSIVLNSIFQSIWLNTRLRINNQLAELFEKMITLLLSFYSSLYSSGFQAVSLQEASRGRNFSPFYIIFK